MTNDNAVYIFYQLYLFLHIENTPYLLFSTQHSIRKLAVGGSNINDYRDIVSGQKGIISLDYDYLNNYVYWTDIRDERICRAQIPGPGSTPGTIAVLDPML